MDDKELEKLSPKELIALYKSEQQKVSEKEQQLEQSKKVIDEQSEQIAEIDNISQKSSADTISYSKKVYKLTIPTSYMNQDLKDKSGNVLLDKGAKVNIELLKKDSKIVGALLAKKFGGLVEIKD
jgi:RNA recognition motif-containing protein